SLAAERRPADPARPTAPAPGEPARERSPGDTPPVPAPATSSGSPPPRLHPAWAAETARRSAEARSADTAARAPFWCTTNAHAQSGSDRPLLFCLRDRARRARAADGVHPLRHAAAGRLRAQALHSLGSADVVAIR